MKLAHYSNSYKYSLAAIAAVEAAFCQYRSIVAALRLRKWVFDYQTMMYLQVYNNDHIELR